MTTDVGNDVAVYEFMIAYDKFKLAEENYKANRISENDFLKEKKNFIAFSKHSDQIDMEELIVKEKTASHSKIISTLASLISKFKNKAI